MRSRRRCTVAPSSSTASWSAFSCSPSALLSAMRCLGGRGVARGAQRADLVGDGLDPLAGLFTASDGGTVLGVGGDQLVHDLGHLGAAPGEPGAHGVGIGTDEADVEHGETVAAGLVHHARRWVPLGGGRGQEFRMRN